MKRPEGASWWGWATDPTGGNPPERSKTMIVGITALCAVTAFGIFGAVKHTAHRFINI